MNRSPVRACGIPIAIALLFTHAWFLSSRSVSPRIGIVSFAVLCLLIGQALASQSLNSLAASHARSDSHSVEVITQTISQPKSTEQILNAFSVDLEDYFHTEVASSAVSYSDWDVMPSRIRPSTSRMLDLLDEHDTRATVFVLGWVARRHPSLVRQIAERGHEIACHSNLHKAVFRLDRSSFYEDTRIAKQSVEDATGMKLLGYRAPSFSMIPGTEWAFEILYELGFQYDSSVNPIRHKFYGNPNSPRHPHRVGQSELIEIPVASWRVAGTNLPVSGGAYLRLLPYSYIRSGLASINLKEHKPYTIYVHPWEIDAYQPRLKLNWRSNIRQSWGISTMEDRIARLLESFRFAPISEVYSDLITPRSTDSHEMSPHELSVLATGLAR
jgi:polysaccharide deacetylase family protein (PEP-CTERM system associated)